MYASTILHLFRQRRPICTHIGTVEHTAAIIRPHHCKPAIQAKVCSSNQLRAATDLIPQCNLLVGDVSRGVAFHPRIHSRSNGHPAHGGWGRGAGMEKHFTFRQEQWFPSELDEMFQPQSQQPYCTLGWKAMAVTKSMCWKQHRHSFLEACQSRTVLSIDEERMK